MLFIIIVVVAFFIFATQAGASESALNVKLGPGGWLIALVVVGAVLYFLYTGAQVVIK